jgi:transcriptional regulator with XRE-family HTH domain
MSAKKTQKEIKSNLHVQNYFISRFKEALPPGLGLAEEIADILNVSIDSAYRRIRCETELTIEEIYKITKKYAISVDEVFGNQSDTVTFAYTKLTDSAENFEAYLTRLHAHLKTMNKFDDRRIYYVAEEMPMFYSFYSKKLCEFKLFYWQRSVLNIPDYQKNKFEWGIIPQNLIDLAYDSYLEYLKIPGTEIWTDETVLTVIKQVGFYFESGIINKEQALELLDEYRQMIELLNKSADSGRKNISDKSETYSL